MISSAKKYPEQAQASNRILVGTSITGDVVSDGDIRVDGKVIGNMKVSGKLVIGEHGRVEGEVECKNAAIAGQLEGTLKVAQTLSLTASAKVQGKVQVEKLAVEPGAEINGSVTMGTVMRKVNEADKDSAQSA
ncbi:MAG: polymer-forming cytoskeletal protein [Schleiferiaceae bacterium]|jgi:cytoskeletal protein CcmA (bactofilin family)|nr:polymer-forming cytoskeletal protein [Schleiferiaceae bacterium]MDP4759741.1 polymer-forming cytoskeletal protein [Schleiferiaceae bacterium]MDP4877498.1 polymer-forming cytoskeletal protein [Schleiferiaceae bacterium]